MNEFTNNLFSIGRVCDANCTVVFTKTEVHVLDSNGNLILRGFREPTGARMWRFNICPAFTPNAAYTASTTVPSLSSPPLEAMCPTPRQPTALPYCPASTEFHRKAYDLPSTRKLIEYIHCIIGSPVKSQFLQAVNNGNFKSFPGISATNVARYCPDNATATVLGHMTQVQQGLRTTKSPRATALAALLSVPPHQAFSPHVQTTPALFDTITAPTNELHIIEVPLSTLFTDDMGRFPVRALSGNQYIMLAYHDSSNVILVQPFQTKADHHRIPAYNIIMERLKARGLKVDTQILDNEASAAYIHCITQRWHCLHQLVPPDMHRRNKAERAIRTFKAHFLSILASVDPAFPKNRWDLLLPQAELTINLLRQSHSTPTISAWEHFNGPYNFDATPMGPPGCRIISHAKASTRRSWDFRGNEGFYVGPALHHYRCYKVIKNTTQAVVVSDTVVFQHPTLDMPTLTTEDRIIHCLRALTIAIRADRTHDNCHAQLLAIESLRAIFNSSTPTSVPSALLPSPPASSPRVLAPPASSPRVLVPTPPSSPPGPVQRMPAPEPRVLMPNISPSQPIAHRTRSQHCLAATATANKVRFNLPTNHIDKDSRVFRNTTQSRDTMYILPSQWTHVPARRCVPTTSSNITTTPPPPTRNRFALLEDDEIDNDIEPTAMACPVLDHDTGVTLEHRQLRRHPKYKDTWDTSYANEIGRLCQGIGKHPTTPNLQRIAGTNTMKPINFHSIPRDRISDVAHTRVVCEVRPTKSDPNRTRITVGGNTINYTGDCGTKTGSLETVKLVINSTLSTPKAEYMTLDLANFYLNTPLDRPEYVRIQLSIMPQEVIDEYNLMQYEYNGWIYFELGMGMYGLKQAGKLANDLLSQRLFGHGYYQCGTTPGLWRHKWRPVMFVLIVDDFGVQFTGRQHAQHLITALQSNYEVSEDWTGSKFSGIDLKWDYIKRTCRLTMDGYITELRLRYGHPNPTKPQHSPHKHRPIIYGSTTQFETDDVDTSEPLDAKGIKRVQGIVGSILYYARAVDNKLLCTVSTIGSTQASATQNTLAECNQLLDHLALHPTDGITYKASNMILAAHSDASYLSESKSRSRAGAHIFLSNDDPIPQSNGPVLSISAVLKSVYSSVAEGELAALYTTAQAMVPLRNTLEEMGWKQPRSPIQVDNSTAEGYVNNTIITRRLKSLEMRLNWLKCRDSQGQFRIFWDKGSHNLADYHTKHHPPEYHIAHRHTHAG